MTTEKQVKANRANARQSTGPRTPEGKAASARNARKHGLLSQQVLLPSEDPEAFNELLEGLIARCSPEGEVELQLVERMASCLWRLRRVGELEVGLFECDRPDPGVERFAFGCRPLTPRGALAVAFVRVANGADALSKLSRYEVSIERSFYNALHELQRLQAARAGQRVAPPVAIDVNVTASEEVKVGA
jgi:hypothetical protein